MHPCDAFAIASTHWKLLMAFYGLLNVSCGLLLASHDFPNGVCFLFLSFGNDLPCLDMYSAVLNSLLRIGRHFPRLCAFVSFKRKQKKYAIIVR